CADAIGAPSRESRGAPILTCDAVLAQRSRQRAVGDAGRSAEIEQPDALFLAHHLREGGVAVFGDDVADGNRGAVAEPERTEPSVEVEATRRLRHGRKREGA